MCAAVAQLGVKLMVSGALRREKWGARAVLHLPVQGRHSLSWGLVQSSLLTGQCDGALFKRNLCLSSVNL